MLYHAWCRWFHEPSPECAKSAKPTEPELVMLEDLFESDVLPQSEIPYKDYNEILDAVQARKKSLFAESVRLDDFCHSDFMSLVTDVIQRGLTIVLHQTVPGSWAHGHEVGLYCLPIEEMWRIPARAALYQAALESDDWGALGTVLESSLLGYTKKQRGDWLRSQRRGKASFDGVTVYAILNHQQAAQTESLGKRCFGAADDISGLRLFFNRRNRAIRGDASRLLPSGSTLARVAVEHSFFSSLFGSSSDWGEEDVIVVTLRSPLAADFVYSIRSNVQFLTEEGWE